LKFEKIKGWDICKFSQIPLRINGRAGNVLFPALLSTVFEQPCKRLQNNITE